MNRSERNAALAAGAILFAFAAFTGASGAHAGDRKPHLVRFTAERGTLLAGGHPTPGCFTVLTAEIAPAARGVEVAFAIVDGTGRGRTAPAMLSTGLVETDRRGIAETFIVSSDAEERCAVEACLAGGRKLQALFEFRRTLAGGKVAAAIDAAPPVNAAPRAGPRHALRQGATVLAAQLKNPSVEVRTAAKRTLLALGRDAVGALVEVAADPRLTPDVRSLAARTLAEMRTEEADDELLALLAHALPDVRAGAEEAVGMMSTTRAESLAETALLSGSPLVRAAALRILGCLATEDASGAIASAFADADPFVRATAAWESARAAGPRAEELLARALNDEETFVRVSAAKAVVLLGRRATDETRALDEILKRALSDADPALRSAAAKAMGLRELTVETALAPLAADPDPRVRLSVAFAFTWRADVRSSLRQLRELTRDSAPAVREVASRAIAESGTEAEADVMMDVLASGDPAMKELAARALRRVTCLDFGWHEARTRAERAAVAGRWRDWWEASADLSREAWLWQALDLPGSKLRGAAGLELARLTPPPKDSNAGGAARRERLRLAAALEEIAGSSRPAERHAAAEALLILGERAGLAPLEADLADARLYVRLGAVRAVAALGDAWPGRDERGAVRLLIRALEDPSVTLRREAARALKYITGESFGYGPRAPAEHRARAVRRWRAWLESLPAGSNPARRSVAPEAAAGAR